VKLSVDCTHHLEMSRVIEIRPFRGGWQCFEAEGVAPYWVGAQEKQDAIGYAAAWAKLNADLRLPEEPIRASDRCRGLVTAAVEKTL